jgi:hypothetical protein
LRLKQCRNCGKIFRGFGAQAFCSNLCRYQRKKEMNRLITRKIRLEKHFSIDTMNHSENPTMDLTVVEINGKKRIKAFLNLKKLRKNP